jgi:hypothetical protein
MPPEFRDYDMDISWEVGIQPTTVPEVFKITFG